MVEPIDMTRLCGYQTISDSSHGSKLASAAFVRDVRRTATTSWDRTTLCARSKPIIAQSFGAERPRRLAAHLHRRGRVRAAGRRGAARAAAVAVAVALLGMLAAPALGQITFARHLAFASLVVVAHAPPRSRSRPVRCLPRAARAAHSSRSRCSRWWPPASPRSRSRRSRCGRPRRCSRAAACARAARGGCHTPAAPACRTAGRSRPTQP